jgi:hypothetical protein
MLRQAQYERIAFCIAVRLIHPEPFSKLMTGSAEVKEKGERSESRRDDRGQIRGVCHQV